MVLASSCCENGFACSTQPRNPQGRLLQVETEKTLANLAIKYELCQKQQLKNYSHELYERMVVILSHVRRLKNPVKWQQCKGGLTDKEISVLENLVSKLVDDEPGPARASLPSTPQKDKSHTDTHQPDDPADCNDSSHVVPTGVQRTSLGMILSAMPCGELQEVSGRETQHTLFSKPLCVHLHLP